MTGYIKYKRRLTPAARRLRADLTPAERKLWYDFLKGHRYKFTRQKPLGSYIADFYCARILLVIELDGESHFHEQAEAYDRRRTENLVGKGIRVARFTNADVMQRFEGVCLAIEAALEP